MDKLLKYKSTDDGSLTIDIELNKVISPPDHCIIYNSKSITSVLSASYNNTVYVFTTPIYINEDSKNMIDKFTNDTNLFSKYDSKYSVLPSSNISRKEEESIYIDCSPSGESQETINTHIVPNNSDAMNASITESEKRTVIHFGFFLISAVFLWIVVPPLYKNIIIKWVLKSKKADRTRLRSVDIHVIILTICLFIFLLFYSETIGFVFLFLSLLCTFLIYSKKYDDEFVSLSPINPEIKIEFKPTGSSFDIYDVGNTFLVLLKASAPYIPNFMLITGLYIIIYMILFGFGNPFGNMDFWVGEYIIFILMSLLASYLANNKPDDADTDTDTPTNEKPE